MKFLLFKILFIKYVFIYYFSFIKIFTLGKIMARGRGKSIRAGPGKSKGRSKFDCNVCGQGIISYDLASHYLR